MKKYFTFVFMIILSISLIGCGNKEGNKEANGDNSNEGSSLIELEFFFPVAVGGPMTDLVEQLAKDFESENENIIVTPIFGGSYQETTTKVMTAIQGGNAPDLAVLSAVDIYSFLNSDVLEKLNDYYTDDYINDFYDGWLANAMVGDDVWSIPFQRSTTVLYYNKDAFKEAGLDPENPPATWEELVEYGKKLTKTNSGGNTEQWGIEIPSTGFQYWPFQGLTLQTGKNIMSEDGKEVFFDSPEAIEALSFWKDLGTEHKIMPEGVIEWATVPSDFLSGKTAMMFHSTGNLANVKNDANFDFGVAMLPKNKEFGTATGGGNIYMFKDIPEENKEAAWKFIEFLTRPDVVAQWSVDTGYIVTRKSAIETEIMREYFADFPEAEVPLNQLEFAHSELATYENGQTQKIINDAIQAALTNKKSVEDALKDAQEQGENVLKSYQ